jgi:hypothetical protein
MSLRTHRVACMAAILLGLAVALPVSAQSSGVPASVGGTADGRFIDPNTGQPITGQYDLGHKPGHEFWRERAHAEAEGLTQEQFNDRMNNPDLYQIESPSSNRSHQHEQGP